MLQEIVKALLSKPQAAQRTPEWYKARHTRVTASEAASCLYKSKKVCDPYINQFNITNFKYNDKSPLNPYETKEEYILKKCSAFYGKNVFKDTIYTLWGKKYEEVANRLYKKLYNTDVHEFGLVEHGRLEWLAASPDGITPNGVMLEIKCPKARKIVEAAPPLYYWIQVQIQLEVCNLEYCDFLECEIEEITEEKFTTESVNEHEDIGILMQMKEQTPEPTFVYPPTELVTVDDYINWRNEYANDSNLIPCYYKVTKYNVMRISRSREWFANVKDDIKSTWDIITQLQSNNEEFENYKQNIEASKNKNHIVKFENTACLIDDSENENDNDNDNDNEYENENDSAVSDTICMIE